MVVGTPGLGLSAAPRRRNSTASHKPSGAGSNILIIAAGDAAGNHGRNVALRGLNEPASACRKIVLHAGHTDPDTVWINDVNVGPPALLDPPAILHTEHLSIQRRVLGDDEFRAEDAVPVADRVPNAPTRT